MFNGDECSCPSARPEPLRNEPASPSTSTPPMLHPAASVGGRGPGAPPNAGLRLGTAVLRGLGRARLRKRPQNPVTHEKTHGRMEDTLSKTSPAICQHALVGTITPTEAKRAPFAEKASKLSQHAHDVDGDRAYGRMRSVKENATTPTETALWEHALAQVCKDECDDLLKMMKEEARNLAKDVLGHQVPFPQTCAERVVKHVEAEVLGCCGRSCGFNGRRCLLWPFFSPKEKVEWELECCAEMNVLKNSSRELMCNSVLSSRLAIAASQYSIAISERSCKNAKVFAMVFSHRTRIRRLRILGWRWHESSSL